MHDASPPLSRTAVLLATLGAILLANVFFWAHGPAVIHDSRGYYELSKVIRQSGLFWCADEPLTIEPGYRVLFRVRTYGYPLFVAVCALFATPDLPTVQYTVFNCQLLLCLVTCYYAAIALQSVFKARGFGTWLYVCSVLNPYVLIQSTELLTEPLSAVLIYLVFVLALRAGLESVQDDNLFARLTSRGSNGPWLVFLTSFLAGLAVMIRPANAAVVFALIGIWGLRALLTRRLSLQLCLLMGLGLFVPCVPQLVNNYRNFHKLQPVVVDSVFEGQMGLGCRFLKYATVDGKDNPQLFYPNPLARPDLAKPGDFLRKRPLMYALTLSLHTFAILDHEFPFTYVRDLHPWYRWPLSLVNYLFLAGVTYGLYLGIRRLLRRRRMDKPAFATVAAVLLSAVYLALYAPCEPESRYSLPLFLVWSPFFVVGSFRVRQLVAYRRTHALITLMCWTVLFVACCVGLSAWMHYETPRLRQAAGGLAYQLPSRSLGGTP